MGYFAKKVKRKSHRRGVSFPELLCDACSPDVGTRWWGSLRAASPAQSKELWRTFSAPRCCIPLLVCWLPTSPLLQLTALSSAHEGGGCTVPHTLHFSLLCSPKPRIKITYPLQPVQWWLQDTSNHLSLRSMNMSRILHRLLISRQLAEEHFNSSWQFKSSPLHSNPWP